MRGHKTPACAFTPLLTQAIHVKDLHSTSWPQPCSCSQLLLGAGIGPCMGVAPFTVHAHLLAWDPTLGLQTIPCCQRLTHPLVL